MRSPRRALKALWIMVLSLGGLGQAAACSGPGAEPAKDPVSAPSAAPPPASAPPVAPAAASATSQASAAPPVSAAPQASAVPSSEPAPKPGCPKGMALIPGGKLAMGAPKKDVTVAPICLDVNEVTADEYTTCFKGGQCTDANLKCAPQATYGADGKGGHPINCVDFSQATAYCKAQSKRLPTDEEWEFAARGAEGRVFPWGNAAPSDQVCWSGKDVHTGTCAVGSTPKGDTPEGIHDLAGNVFEWTTAKTDAKTDVRDGRGGSWKDGAPELLHSARPGAFKVTYRCGFLGIRCAIDAPPGATAK